MVHTAHHNFESTYFKNEDKESQCDNIDLNYYKMFI